jgi:putative endonuclease
VSVGLSTLHRVEGDSRSDLGAAGERAALQRYAAAGYRLLAANWRCSLGELDLVLTRASTLVVCEVKTRRDDGRTGRGVRGGRVGLGGPFDAVTREKQARIRRLTEAFLAGRPSVAASVGEVRFDVASVTIGPGGQPDVHVFEDAF